ncbi:MAG: hypothetical protein KDD47_04335 [Acidobacteria bacterium]|nr:hypothetical protein [Acidobacteriota bacterium]
MSMTLSSFLIEASQNPALLRQLRETPQDLARETGLSSYEMEALLSEDPVRVHAALEGGEFAPLPLMLTPQSVVDN